MSECRIVAEAGTCNHSIDYAIEAAQAAAKAGADFFKVQMLNSDTLVSGLAEAYGKGLTEPSLQRDTFGGALPYPDWADVKDACDDLGIEFFASCWDHAAVDACMAMGVDWFKIGSADITYESLIRYVGETGKRVMLSTGGATLPEISRALEWLGDSEVVPFVCTLSYPCEPEDAHLARLTWWLENGWTVGYSDHTVGLDTMFVAAMSGASYVEKHFTLTPGAGGDHDFAVTADQLEYVCEGLPEEQRDDGWILPPARVLLGDSWIGPREIEAEAILGARRSWHTKEPTSAGSYFTFLRALRPGGGIEATIANYEGIRHSLASRDYVAGELIDPQELQ